MKHAVTGRRICTSMVAAAIALLLLLAVADVARADDDDDDRGKKNKRGKEKATDRDNPGEDDRRAPPPDEPLPRAAANAPPDEAGACVPGLEVRADQDVNQLSWHTTAAGDEHAIHRGTNGRPYETLVVLPAENTTYADHEVVPGAVYRYQVTSATSGPHSTCMTVEVTAVPDLPGTAACLAALGIGMCAYRLARRRAR